MEILPIKIEKPEDCNIIIGQSHFIKTVEDLYEVLTGAVPQICFGIAFCEASGACLVRSEGNDEKLKKLAIKNAFNISAGHSFVILLKNAFPINVLNAIKGIQEVCTIFCATANQLEVLIVETSLGRGVIGIIDGEKPRGEEGPDDILWRKNLLRKIGYKK